MNGPQFVAWMEENGWSVGGLADAGGWVERSLYRWRQSERTLPRDVLRHLELLNEHTPTNERVRRRAVVVD